MTWLLLLPVVVLIFITPPALLPQAGVPSVRTVPTEALRRPFAPLPAGRAPEITDPQRGTAPPRIQPAPERQAHHRGWFTVHDGDAVGLGRLVVMCCAADAQLAQVHLGGALARGPCCGYTWLRAEGIVQPGPANGDSSVIPTLEVAALAEIEPPEDAYA